MLLAEDVGGVHVKYLHHCRRQLWLYARGIRPEHLSSTVQYGEAVHETSYPRSMPIDQGAARLDQLDGDCWVHEIKSSASPTHADEAQALHYCFRLHELGVPAQGAVLHYPKTRTTRRIDYTPEQAHRAQADITKVLATTAAVVSPPRLSRSGCRGCSFIDYCWSD